MGKWDGVWRREREKEICSNIPTMKALLGCMNLSKYFMKCKKSNKLKCHCNEKIFGPILNTTEQHFHTSLNGVFSFSISCFVLEILRFFETCKLGVSDVIYSRIINYIYQMVNISVNSGQKFFKLCMTIAIW